MGYRQKSVDNATPFPPKTCLRLRNAILEDDLATCSLLIEQYPSSAFADLDRLPHVYRDHLLFDGCPRFSTPLMVAAMRGSNNCFEYFLSSRIFDLESTEADNNLVHALVWAASIWPAKTDIYREMYKLVVRHAERGTLLRLLMKENDLGLRPVEMASVLGTLRLLTTILSTEGVYMFTKEAPLLQRHVWYDVTEYHITTGNRHFKSPFLQLMFLQKKKLLDPETKPFMISPLMKEWKRSSTKGKTWFIISHVMGRLIYSIVFWLATLSIRIPFFGNARLGQPESVRMYSIDNETSLYLNQTNFDKAQERCRQQIISDQSNAFLGLIGTSCLIAVSIDCIIFIVQVLSMFVCILYLRRKDGYGFCKYTFRLGRETISSIRTNNVISLTQSLLFLSISPVILTRQLPDAEEDPYTFFIINLFIALSSLLNVWNILYYMQLFPNVGFFVITFQRMLTDMLKFSLLLNILIWTFALTFYGLFRQNEKMPFTDFILSYHTSFLIILNMVDITDFLEPDSPKYYVYIVLHVFYVLMVAISVLNFLIAVMSSTVSSMDRHKDVYYTLTILTIMNIAELDAKPFPFLRRRLGQGVIHHDGRVFLSVWYDLDEYEDL